VDINESSEEIIIEEKKKINKWRLIKNLVLWSLNIVIVVLIVWWITKQNITSSVLDIFKSWQLPVYIVVFLLLMLVKAFRYCQLQTSKLSFKKSVMGINLGFFLNSLIPARIGDISRIIYLSSTTEGKNNDAIEEETTEAKPGDYIGSMVFEKLFDLFSLLIITAIIIFVTSIYLFEDIWPIIVVAVSLIVLIVIAVILVVKYHKFFDRIIEWFISKFRGEIKQEINLSEQVNNYTKNLIKKPKKIILNVFLSLFIVLVDTILIYLILSTILVDLPIYLGILAGAVGFLSVIFPLLPGGLGTYEGSMVLALVFFGYVKELILTASFSEHILRTAIYIIIGLPTYIIILVKQRNKSKMLKNIDENDNENIE